MQYLFAYLSTLLVFFALDMLWLGLVAKDFYRSRLSFVLSEQVNWTAAIVFYLIYIAGIVFFAVAPALKQQSLQLALIHGAVLGLLCYATYDLTNMATIAKWPLTIVVVDILWGTVLTASCAAGGYTIARLLLR